MKHKYPASRILAFEPAPQTHAILCQNLQLHGVSGVETHQIGLGDRENTATFTYYAAAPGNSTLYPDQKQGLKELVVSKYPEHGELIMKQWLGGEKQIEIPIQPLSHFLTARDVDSIDLLKIDVEGAEFTLLNGLDDEHWPLIKNVVMELSEIRNEGALGRMVELLEEKGFVVTHEAAHPDFSKDLFIVKGHRTA